MQWSVLVKDNLENLLYEFHVCYLVYCYTVVSCICAPRFVTLVLVESVGGGLYAGSDILSREYAPSSGATPRC